MPCAAALPPTYGTYFFFVYKKEVSKKKRVSEIFFPRKEVKQEKRNNAVCGGVAAYLRHLLLFYA